MRSTKDYVKPNGRTRTAVVKWTRNEKPNDGFIYDVSVTISNGAGGSWRCKGQPNTSRCLRLIADAKIDTDY